MCVHDFDIQSSNVESPVQFIWSVSNRHCRKCLHSHFGICDLSVFFSLVGLCVTWQLKRAKKFFTNSIRRENMMETSNDDVEIALTMAKQSLETVQNGSEQGKNALSKSKRTNQDTNMQQNKSQIV